MAISIRLSRGGSKKRPYYRIVVVDVRSPRDGKFIEKIGSYNPLLPRADEQQIKVDVQRARHWLRAGALPTERVARLLEAAGVQVETVQDNPADSEPEGRAAPRPGRWQIRRPGHTGASAEGKIADRYTLRVGLAIDDPAAVARLQASAEKLMAYLGFETSPELVSAE